MVITSVRPAYRFGAIAMLMAAVAAWRMRHGVSRLAHGALLGLSLAIPLGLLTGFCIHFSILPAQHPYYEHGNVALDLTIIVALIGFASGALVQYVCWALRTGWAPS